MAVETIGLGMLASFFLTETLGFAAGGIVVPGYIALALSEPTRLVSTILVALVTYFILKFLGRFILLFGRRTLLLGVLTGYSIGYLTKLFPPISFASLRADLSVIGYVIPGLIAYWMTRQGVIPTLSSMFIAAVLVRLLITAISGGVF